MKMGSEDSFSCSCDKAMVLEIDSKSPVMLPFKEHKRHRIALFGEFS